VTREKTIKEYTEMPIMDLIDNFINGSFVAGIAEEVIIKRVGGMEKEIERLGGIIVDELGGNIA